MPIFFNPPSVYFMHIPKTGGSATANWLRSMYRARDYIDLTIHTVAELSLERLASFRCYHSVHHGLNLMNMTSRSDLTVFTVLRDPLERSVSNFEHHRRQVLQHPERFSARIKSRANKDIVDIEYQQLANVVSTQSDFLGSRCDYATFFQKHRERSAAGDQSSLLQSHAIERVDSTPQQTFDRAVTWLRTMPVVGLTERFYDSMQLIADLIGAPPPARRLAANINPQRHDFNQLYRSTLHPEALAKLEQINRYDFELYAIARDLFEAQWARFCTRRSRRYSISPRLKMLKHRLFAVPRLLDRRS